jgi:hypothetical protein
VGVLKESVPGVIYPLPYRRTLTFNAGDLSGVDFDLNMDFGDVGAGKHRHV